MGKILEVFLTFFADLFNTIKKRLMKRKMAEDIDDDILENGYFEEENVKEIQDPLLIPDSETVS